MRVEVTSAAADDVVGDVVPEALQKLTYCAIELSKYWRPLIFVVSPLRSIQLLQAVT